MRMTGAELIIALLEREGIEVIAGIPGGANLPIYDALARRNKIRHILTRHEQGAGFIAQGMARVNGRPQVCFATSGPGVTNVVTAIADAKLDSVPIVCISGQVPSSMIGTDAFQEVDAYGLTIPITKHNFMVRSVEELLRIIPEAFRIAASHRPGPVLIDVPKDIQLTEIEFNHWPAPSRPAPYPQFSQADLTKAAEMIKVAQRPVLYVGGGIVASGASNSAVALAEKGSIPMTVTLMGLGTMPPEHPLYLGMLGMHADKFTNLVMAECDLLIAAGVRFDDRATGRLESFCPNAKIIHMDIDPCEVHKLKTATVGIIGDVGAILDSLLPIIPKISRQKWLGHIAEIKQNHQFQVRPPYLENAPATLIKDAATLLGPEAIIVTDVGQHQMWTAQHYPFRRPRRFLTSGGLGTMGFGLPAAIGAALADPSCQVVCFSGDGSLMMNIQELATAVEENVNIKIILMNNNALGLVQQQQDLFYGRRRIASQYRHPVNFVQIAQGFGMKTFDLNPGNNRIETLAAAFEHSGPCLVHIPIDPEEKVYPMVPPGASNTEMIGGEYAVVN